MWRGPRAALLVVLVTLPAALPVASANHDRVREPFGPTWTLCDWETYAACVRIHCWWYGQNCLADGRPKLWVSMLPQTKAGAPFVVQGEVRFDPTSMPAVLEINPRFTVRQPSVDPLPAGISCAPTQGGGFRCTVGSWTVSSWKFNYRGIAPDSLPPSTRFRDRIEVEFVGYPLWNPGERRFENATTFFTSVVDLQTAIGGPSTVGATASTFTATVRNAGQSPAPGATVRISGGPHLALAPTEPGCRGDARTIVCDLGTLQPGQSATRAFRATAKLVGATQIVAVAERPANTGVDANPGNDRAQTTVVATLPESQAGTPRVSVSLTRSGTGAVPVGNGDQVRVRAINEGTAIATGNLAVRVGTAFVAGLTVPTGCSRSGTFADAEYVLTCPPGQLLPRSSVEYAFGFDSRDVAFVPFAAETRPTSLGNGAVLVVPVERPPHITTLAYNITGPPTLSPGERARYTVTVGTSGPGYAPAQVFGVYARGDGSVESFDAGSCMRPRSGPGYLCEMGAVSGTARSVVFTVAASAKAGGSFTVHAGSASLPVAIPSPSNDLAFTELSASPASPQVGDEVTVTIGVSNRGPAAATNAYVQATIPERLDIQQDAYGPCVRIDRVVRCFVGAIDAGATRWLNVTLTATLADTYVAVARTGQTQGNDSDASNDERTLTVTVRPVESAKADLAVSRAVATPATPSTNESASVAFLVENLGDAASGPAFLEVGVPAGLAMTGADCTRMGATLRCALGSLGPRERRDLVFQASAEIAGTYSMRALALSGNDPAPANDARTLDLVVAATPQTGPDLTISSATLSSSRVHAAEPFTLRLVALNLGPGDARGAFLEVLLPAGVALGPNAPCTAVSSTVRCDVATLASGAAATTDVPLVASRALEGEILAAIRSSARDPEPSNDNARVPLVVQAASDTRALAPLPVARSSLVGGYVGGRLLAVGGHNAGARTDADAYDARANAWSGIRALPEPRYGGASAVFDGKLWVLGGWSTRPPLPNSHVFLYDPGTDVWSLGPRLPKLSGCSAGAASTTVYLYSTCDGYSGYRKDFWTLSADRLSWVAAPAPTPAHVDAAAAATASGFFLLGGNDGYGRVIGSVSRYVDGSWSSGAPMPTPRQGASAVAVGDRIYVIGGSAGGAPVASVEVYDTRTDAWTVARPLSTPRTNALAVLAGSAILVVGGSEGTGPVATVESIADAATVRAHPSGKSWRGNFGAPDRVG